MIDTNIQLILIVLSIVNITLISLFSYKRKYSIAWTLALLEALIIGGTF